MQFNFKVELPCQTATCVNACLGVRLIFLYLKNNQHLLHHSYDYITINILSRTRNSSSKKNASELVIGMNYMHFHWDLKEATWKKSFDLFPSRFFFFFPSERTPGEGFWHSLNSNRKNSERRVLSVLGPPYCPDGYHSSGRRREELEGSSFLHSMCFDS